MRTVVKIQTMRDHDILILGCGHKLVVEKDAYEIGDMMDCYRCAQEGER